MHMLPSPRYTGNTRAMKEKVDWDQLHALVNSYQKQDLMCLDSVLQ